MRAEGFDGQLLAEHRASIVDEPTRNAFDFLVAHAASLTGYNCRPALKGTVRDFRYFDRANGEQPYAFIVNRGSLLFYVRQPGLGSLVGGQPGLERVCGPVGTNKRGELTVRVSSEGEARLLTRFLFRRDDARQASSTVLDRCVYTIIRRDKFEAALISGRLAFEEGKRWAGAKTWLDEARRTQRQLVLVLADAERCHDLIGWGVVDDLTLGDGTTNVVASSLRRLSGRTQQELTVFSNKEPIAEGHIRPYVLCETPDFVFGVDTAPVGGDLGPRTPELGGTKDDRRMSETSGAPSAAADVEADPVLYELVQRRLRQHQSAFRDTLMTAYDGRCAISGTDVATVLEAAHIEPHVERGDNSSENGVILRSDLHALFDEGLLRIHPTTFEVWLDPTLLHSVYADLNGRVLRARADGKRPSVLALEARWRAGARRGGKV